MNLQSIRVGDVIEGSPSCGGTRKVKVLEIEDHPRGNLFDGTILDSITLRPIPVEPDLGTNRGWLYGDQITRVVPVSFVKVAS